MHAARTVYPRVCASATTTTRLAVVWCPSLFRRGASYFEHTTRRETAHNKEAASQRTLPVPAHTMQAVTQLKTYVHVGAALPPAAGSTWLACKEQRTVNTATPTKMLNIRYNKY